MKRFLGLILLMGQFGRGGGGGGGKKEKKGKNSWATGPKIPNPLFFHNVG